MTLALRVIGAVLCIGAAPLARTEATRLRAEADGWQQLVTLQYDAVSTSEPPPAGMLDSLLGGGADDQRRHATVDYWLGRYRDLVEQRGGSSDPDVLFVAANAAYRLARNEGRIGPEGARRLDGVLQAYADVLKLAPDYTDAAFNFEYVARLRSYLERMKPGPGVRAEDEPQGAGPIRPTDLPRGPTVHGVPGGPPVNVQVEEFEILVPRESGEEDAPPGQSRGGRLRRKG
jgi:hypothetical protein